ncbi:MAG TPA: DUF4202 domain-containing protein [Tepidisphaeraceae bacterium]|jgi:hypothetical protein|nr:DUF4202 domain-containing protein [Tepidisphaeraceae bacterium]
MAERLAAAIAAIDVANAEDPRGEEVVYSRRMSEWLEKLAPEASEALRLAARAQHLRRWEIPRSSFPMDRIGYLKWRTTLYQFHADRVGEILGLAGYEESLIARVQSLVKKERLKVDAEAQLLEDVICLVFLQYEFAEFMAQHEEPKVINILQRTWKKMSPMGHEAALGLVASLPEGARGVLQRALAS